MLHETEGNECDIFRSMEIIISVNTIHRGLMEDFKIIQECIIDEGHVGTKETEGC